MSRRRHRGFTLVETMVAGAVFFIFLLGMSLMSTYSSRHSGQGLVNTEAAKLAEQLVEERAMLGYSAGDSASEGTIRTADGRTHRYIVTVVDTGGVVTPQDLGVPSRLIKATVFWKHTTRGELSVTHQSYTSL